MLFSYSIHTYIYTLFNIVRMSTNNCVFFFGLFYVSFRHLLSIFWLLLFFAFVMERQPTLQLLTKNSLSSLHYTKKVKVFCRTFSTRILYESTNFLLLALCFSVHMSRSAPTLSAICLWCYAISASGLISSAEKWACLLVSTRPNLRWLPS